MQPRILLFDFETTGLQAGYHEPIQIAALLVTPELEEVASFETLIRPLRPENASPEALEIHKKPLEELLAAPHPADVLKRLRDFAEPAGSAIACGFNVRFDLRFLAALEQEHGITIPREADPILCARVAYLDSKGLSIYTKGTKLTNLCGLYGIDTEGAHDALADVRMTLKLLRAMKEENPASFAFLEPITI